MEKEITQRNEIVSVLNNIRLKHLSVAVKEEDSEFSVTGFITKADTNSISLFFEKIPDYIPLKNLKISFDYNRNFYTSENTGVKQLNLPVKNIEIYLPDKFLYHPIRKFTRVDISNSLMLNIKKVVKNPGDGSSGLNIDELPATLRNIYLELQADAPDMKKIVGMVGDELTRYSNRFRINLFKDINTVSPIEKVVNIYKKTFWIGDTDNLNNYLHLGDKYSVIGYEKYFDMVKKTAAPDVLEQIRQNYLSKGISSYAMVPIIVGERVVGVIEVSVPNEPAYKKLTIYEIFYIKGLADILGEIIVKSHGETVKEDSDFTIKDLSIGGILANTKNVYLTHSIKENNIVMVNLKADNKEIDIPSRVVRYHYMPGDNAGLNVAFEFIYDQDSKKTDLTAFIKKYVRYITTSEQKGEMKTSK
ncbi:MAG: PilZ domain-containing protein [Brevinematales bacterium]